MGFITLPHGQDWRPGETIEADLDLGSWPELEPELVTGRTWKIREGRQIVGSGVILDRLG